MSENIGTTYSTFYKDLPMGIYRYAIQNDSVSPPVPVVIDVLTDIHHSTSDSEDHITDSDTTLRHTYSAIDVAPLDVARLGATLEAAFDNCIGATWAVGVDASLKGHLDSLVAHLGSSIVSLVGVAGSVEDVLLDHETRITALEVGTALTPTGILDSHADLGILIYWTHQDVVGIEYAVRFLWKHVSEAPPTVVGDLPHWHVPRGSNTEIFYSTRYADLIISPDTDIVLYYAVGARARADLTYIWSTVKSLSVTIPAYTQVFSGALNSLGVCAPTCSSGGSVLGTLTRSKSLDSDFPEGTESGGVPTAGFEYLEFLTHDVIITGIEFESGTAMSGDTTLKFRSTTNGASGSFVISSVSRNGSISDIYIPIDAGDQLQLWQVDYAPEMGFWSVNVYYQIR
jgi:hypothetical protein